MVHPVFDAAAKMRAQQLASAAGKASTRAPGLLAIHAVLHRKRFRVDEDAYSFYGVKKQRFYEWKPLITPVESGPGSAATAPTEPSVLEQMLVRQPAIDADTQTQQALYEAWQVEVLTIQYYEEQTAGFIEQRHKWARRIELGLDPMPEGWPGFGASFGASFGSFDQWQEWTEDPRLRALDCVRAERLGIARGQFIVKPEWLRVNTPTLLDAAAKQGLSLAGSPRASPASSDDESDVAEDSKHSRKLYRCVGVDYAADGTLAGPDERVISCAIKSIVYSLPPSPGENAAAQQQRKERHRRREEAVLQKLEIYVAGQLGKSSRVVQQRQQLRKQRERMRMSRCGQMETAVRICEDCSAHLVLMWLARVGFWCDICGEALPADQLRFGCADCNFDVCSVCSGASVDWHDHNLAQAAERPIAGESESDASSDSECAMDE